ncbi:MAG: hypothetical protein RIQ89_788 [Bacteroidota bacterium]|jgi:valyl-tRNA synthetase
MELPKTYTPKAIEEKWYQYWLDQNFFSSVPDDREPYTIVIPPPNVTGVLHMGHMLNNTIQDVLIRRARMLGKNACWVPGTDHASIATEAKVVNLLDSQGIKKQDLSRDEFLKHAFAWKEKYGGIILEQLKKLGASCDWNRTAFTMDEGYYQDVVKVFVNLYNKGYIYRGMRLVNWDPVAKTAVSDEEVIFSQVNSKMCYVKYAMEDGNGYLTVATVRPETIMGDVAIAVHPDDERYKALVGKQVIVPIVNRKVPIITDSGIDITFGTGCLKVTPAHDMVDYEIGIKNKLPIIDVINDDGTIAPAAQAFVGLDRFVARKKAIAQLQADGLLEKLEDYSHQVGKSERTDAVIEPKLSMQWFLKMKEISEPALNAVVNGEINLIPQKFFNTYKYWMENVRDWCLSRQLWWGHRIPAWYDANGNFVVALTHEAAITAYKEKFSDLYNDAIVLKQDEDVLDTWASSWLWPISVFDGISKPDNAEINYYYPTNDLVTAPEILFFWVARMIMAGKEYRKAIPFKNVYLTGIVRDKQGRKMSKSLGNSPDPLVLIEKYGADGVRVGMLLSSPAGNDLLFDESLCEQGRNFSNKIWNAFRLVKGWETDTTATTPPAALQAIEWFKHKFSEQLNIINEHYEKYRMSDALMASYKLVWDDFCANYLEIVKPAFVDGKPLPVSSEVLAATSRYFEDILKVLHPWMPFITEELWHNLSARKERDCIIVAEWPQMPAADHLLLQDFENAFALINQIRNARNAKGISPKQALKVAHVQSARFLDVTKATIMKLANVSELIQSQMPPELSAAIVIGGSDFYISFGDQLDLLAEVSRIKEEILYNQGFLKAVQSKLANERFVQHAKPEVVAVERKKEADTISKIKSLEQTLVQLKH